jgi:integrase/recombinase XerD
MTVARVKVLTPEDQRRVLAHLLHPGATRYPRRDVVMFLLSVRLALRAGELSRLRWRNVTTAAGQIGDAVEVAALKGSRGRTLPMPDDVRQALVDLYQEWRPEPNDAVIFSERSRREGMCAASVSEWFGTLYRRLGLLCGASHAGRRTCATRWAQSASDCGGSLYDVMTLPGHRSLSSTQAYIAGCEPAQRRLVEGG